MKRIIFKRHLANLKSTLSQNLTEKIVQRYAVDLLPGHTVQSGQFISIRPRHVMTHDNTAAVIQKFEGLGCQSVVDDLPVFIMDHDIQNKSEKNLEKYDKIKKFARKHGIDFYPPGCGIGHQVMIEQGYAFPNTLTVASDSHSNMYGGIGCLGTPVVRTDAAAIWSTGKTWWKVPPVVKVELHGALNRGIVGKDLIVALCGYFSNDEVLNCAVEFQGEGVRSLSIDDRLAVSNMTTEWGALSGLFPVDEDTIRWFRKRIDIFQSTVPSKLIENIPSLRTQQSDGHPRINAASIDLIAKENLEADPDAKYAKILHINLSTLKDSFIAGPNSVKTVKPLSQLESERIRVNKGYLVSCVNSRQSDITEAANVFRTSGSKVAKGVEFYIAAASAEVERDAKLSGDWQTLLNAGAVPLPPGCGPCIGLGQGLLKDGEVGISATNRNFKGRMGSPKALAYLASPRVVASSVINGYISGSDLNSGANQVSTPDYWMEHLPIESRDDLPIELVKNFPESVNGDLIFCPSSNINTDGIYPGKYTYREDLSPSQMAKVVMENYDSTFVNKIKAGNILVCGKNFGSGSSREQAATALKFAGIKIIIAQSFSETYRRNAFNNGLICLQVSSLVEYLSQKLNANKDLTVVTGLEATLDFKHSSIKVDGNIYRFDPLGRTAQELVVEDGLENIIKKLQTKRL